MHSLQHKIRSGLIVHRKRHIEQPQKLNNTQFRDFRKHKVAQQGVALGQRKVAAIHTARNKLCVVCGSISLCFHTRLQRTHVYGEGLKHVYNRRGAAFVPRVANITSNNAEGGNGFKERDSLTSRSKPTVTTLTFSQRIHLNNIHHGNLLHNQLCHTVVQLNFKIIL